MPEFAALLAVPPDPGDPLTAQVRAQRVGVEVLRAVASRKRPVVVFLDDLQWAGRTPLGAVDLVLSEEPIEGLLLVGAYREVDAAHPMTPMLSRWREQAGAWHVRLENLPVSSLVAMVAEVLTGPRSAAAPPGRRAASTQCSIGPNVGLLAAVVPQFAVLLEVEPVRRGRRCGAMVGARQAAAVVLQWAGRTPLGFVDLLVAGHVCYRGQATCRLPVSDERPRPR